MDDKSHLSGFKASLGAQATRIIVNGLVILLLTRYFLTPDEYGLLFLAISIFGSALLFSRIGLPKSTARYVTEYREVEPEQIRNIVWTSLVIIITTSIVVGAVLVNFRHYIAGVFDEHGLTVLLTLGFFYVLFRTLNNYLYTLFQGFNHIARGAFVSISSSIGLLFGILLFVGLGYGVPGVLVGYVVGYGFGTIVGLVLLYRILQKYESHPVEPGLRRKLLEYSVPLTATNSASILYKRADTLLIGFFLTPLAVGYYTLAKQLADFVITPAESLGFTLSPSYGELKASDDRGRAAQIYEMAFEHTVLFYVPAATGLIIVAEPTIEFIFGPAYAGSVPVIQVFSGFIVLQAIDKITNDGLDYLGRAKHRAMIKTTTAVLNFGLNLALIPTIGVVGAAISTVVSYGIMVSVNVYLIHTELSLSLAQLARSTVFTFGVTVCMSVVVLLLLPIVSNLVTLFIVVVAGTTAWGILALASGIPDPDLVIT